MAYKANVLFSVLCTYVDYDFNGVKMEERVVDTFDVEIDDDNDFDAEVWAFGIERVFERLLPAPPDCRYELRSWQMSYLDEYDN